MTPRLPALFIAFLLSVLSLIAGSSDAYIESSREDSTTSTHQFLMDFIPGLFDRDGHPELAGLLRNGWLRSLKAGSVAADAHLFSMREHYMSPDNHAGLLDFSSAGGRAEAEVAIARQAWGEGQREKALHHLGWAMHLVQDLTVPHHARLTFLDYHREYELWVLARQSELPKADTGMYTFEFHAPGHFSNESRAWDWVDYAAHSSSPLFDRVDGPDGVEGNDYRAVATQMVPLSARTSAGFLYRMLETFDAGPPTANAGPDLIVSAGALIELDARRSIDDMAIHGYEWRLPDGIVTHEFLASFQARSDGEYEVELIVTDAFGKSSSDMVRIRVTQVTSPVRVVLPQITEAVAGVPVSVTLDLSDGSVPSYVVWALDSETSNGPVFQHTFWRPGLYTVRVRVMTSSGLLLNGEFLVKVRDVLSPAASILAPAEAHTGELVSFSGFDSSDDSGIVDYYWSFGDGTTTRGPVVEHRYDSEGAFIVTLEVADSDGNRDRATVIIRVLLIPYTPGVGVNLWDFLTPLMIAFMILSGTYLAFWVMRVPSQRSHRNRKSASNTGEKKT